MKNRNLRLDAIKMILSSRELGSQGELLQELNKEGFHVTQATLSRDLKRLKVARATSITGDYVYVLPNDAMYRRITEHKPAKEMLNDNGFISIAFSGNMAVVKTRPGYASLLAYDIDNASLSDILGTIAGDDTVFVVLQEGSNRSMVEKSLQSVIAKLQL